MEKSKTYESVFFAPEVLREARETFENRLPEETVEANLRTRSLELVTSAGVAWTFDSEEEFSAEYRDLPRSFSYSDDWGMEQFSVRGSVHTASRTMNARVNVRLGTRADIEAVFDVFERHLADARIPPPPPPPPVPPKVFIGHGQSTQWRDLKDHLQDKHDIDVVAYEIGARAGHAIRGILEDMLAESNMAILVMTAEDENKEGRLHARENVIHELGLFQGRLGFDRAVVLLEESTEEFSNIHGIHQVRYSKGNIKETFGEVLATLKREFA